MKPLDYFLELLKMKSGLNFVYMFIVIMFTWVVLMGWCLGDCDLCENKTTLRHFCPSHLNVKA